MPDRGATIVAAQAFAPACAERGAALREQAFAETAVTQCRTVLVVAQGHGASHDAGDADIGRTQAIVGVLEVTVERGVEAADALQAIAPDIGECECDRLHAALPRILRDLAFYMARFGLLTVQVVRFDKTTDVIHAALGFGAEQAAADDAILRSGISGIAQSAEPIGLDKQEVVVEQDDIVFWLRSGDASVHAPHETEIVRQADDAHAIGVYGKCRRRFVVAAVVDHDDLARIEFTGEQRIQAALGEWPSIPRQHDQGSATHGSNVRAADHGPEIGQRAIDVVLCVARNGCQQQRGDGLGRRRRGAHLGDRVPTPCRVVRAACSIGAGELHRGDQYMTRRQLKRMRQRGDPWRVERVHAAAPFRCRSPR